MVLIVMHEVGRKRRQKLMGVKRKVCVECLEPVSLSRYSAALQALRPVSISVTVNAHMCTYVTVS